MRKLSYLFSLLVLSIVCGGTAWADDGKYYSAGTVVTSVDQIKEGVDYALKGTGVSPCSSTYLNVVMDGNGGSASLTSDCIYQFESAGTVDGKPAFYLKQKSNGMYLRKPGKPTDVTFGYPNENTPDGWGADYLALTSDKNDAWQFWAGVAQSTDENDPFYYNKGTEGKEVMFVFTCTTVLTGDDAGDGAYRYLSSWSSGHNIMQYVDTNVWNLWTDISEIVGTAKLSLLLGKLLPAGPEGAFTPGENPGDVSQDAYNKLDEVFKKCQAFIDGGGTSDDEANALCDELQAAYDNCKNAIVMVEAGKYYFITGNKGRSNTTGRGTIYSDGSNWKWDYAASPVTDLKYAVMLEKGSTDSTFYIKSPINDTYMEAINGNSNTIKAVAKGKAADYIIGHSSGSYFYMTNPDISQGVHAQENGMVCVGWDFTADASQWVFQTISDDMIEKIDSVANQAKLNATLNSVYSDASTVYSNSRAYTSDATPDNDYTSHGLLTDASQIFTSKLVDTSIEGSGLDCLLNGVLAGGSEYIHSTWQTADAPNHYHFFGADLKKAVSAVTVKYSRRMSVDSWKTGQLSYPTKMRVYAANDTTTATGDWTWVGDMTPAFVAEDSTLAGSIDLGGNYQYVRFDVIATGNNGSVTSSTIPGAKAYPFFYMSELGIYEATYDAANSPFSQVPEADGKALEDALKAARPEILEEKATQPTIDALQSAYDKFCESYADPQLARDAYDKAQTMLDSAVVGKELGQVSQEAYDNLKSVMATCKDKIQNVMTMETLTEVLNSLEEACNKLVASAVMPAANKYYYILSTGNALKNAAIAAANNKDGQRLTIGARTADGAFDEATAMHNYEFMWLLEQDEDGKQYLRNVGTGFYMNGNTTANPSTTAARTPVQIVYGKYGQFNVVILENDSTESGSIYLNNNESSVNKYTLDNNCYYAFQEVDFSDDPFTYVGVSEGWQFKCLPYAVVGCSNGSMYKVLGINSSNQLVLQITEEAAPGEPFAYRLNDGSEATEDDFGVDMSQGLVSEGKVVNGVEGLLSGITLSEGGYGVLSGTADTLTVTTGSKVIGNNSAIVTKSVPVIDEEGDYTLEIDGTITGVETGIEGIVIVPKDGKIYDLQGRRVTKPGKGVYIIDGKKVFFK